MQTTTDRQISARDIVVALYRGKVVACYRSGMVIRRAGRAGPGPACGRRKLRAEKARKMEKARKLGELENLKKILKKCLTYK